MANQVVVDAIRRMELEPGGFVLLCRLREQFPFLSDEEFYREISRLANEGQLVLRDFDGPEVDIPSKRNDLVLDGEGRPFVAVARPQASPAAAIEQPASAASSAPKKARKRRAKRKNEQPAPVELDISDERVESWTGGEMPDIVLNLEERYPDDPGQLSGASLRLMEFGDGLTLEAGFGTHFVGQMFGVTLLRFLRLCRSTTTAVSVALWDLTRGLDSPAGSGASLVFDQGNLSIWFGEHCCGQKSGALVEKFLKHAWVRSFGGVTGKNVPTGDPMKGNVVSINIGRLRGPVPEEVRFAV